MNTTETTITTDRLLETTKTMRRAVAQIAKSRKTWKIYTSGAKAGRFNAEQVASAQQVLRESIAQSLAVLIECGMYVSQMDEGDIEVQAEAHANRIIA
jgi:hypothetical protein